jgi:hypothetical protein
MKINLRRSIIFICLSIVYLALIAYTYTTFFSNAFSPDNPPMGAGILELKLPPSSGVREMIRVYDEYKGRSISTQGIESIVSRTAIRKVSNGSQQVTEVDLPEAQWQAINTLRVQWCQGPPRMDDINEGEPIYEVVLDCGSLNRKRFIVPVDELPPQLETLIRIVPSPIGQSYPYPHSIGQPDPYPYPSPIGQPNQYPYSYP